MVVAISIFAINIPTGHALQLLRGDCEKLIGTPKNRCIRMQSRKAETIDTRQSRMQNSDLIRKRRLLRRADIGGVSTGQKSIEQLRKDRREDLRNRRSEMQSNFQHRYDQRNERAELEQQRRNTMLRSRFSQTGETEIVDRSELRSRNRRLHERSQSRRQAIKRAHEMCKSYGIGERQECLRKVREGTLEE